MRPAEPVHVTAEPLPGRPFVRQRWRNAVFLHWRVDPAAVAPLLPVGTRPDESEPGVTWVGLIPFRLEASQFSSAALLPRRIAARQDRLRWAHPLPPVPWLGTFLELNVRLYSVGDDGRRGVVFRTLEAQHLLPVLAARAGLALPYRWARMRSRRRGEVLEYGSQRIGGGGPRTRIAVRTTREPVAGDPDSDFLTARWGMHVRRGGRTRYWRNEHEPWPLFRAELLRLDDELVAASGLPFVASVPPDSVLWSPGVSTAFALPDRA